MQNLPGGAEYRPRQGPWRQGPSCRTPGSRTPPEASHP